MIKRLACYNMLDPMTNQDPDIARARPKLRQRADLTHKHNRLSGRHGWLRLTPAYSVKIVEQILANADPDARVLDPFSGTATTALCAAMHGHSACTVDINPFLIWLGNAKVAKYSHGTVRYAQELGEAALCAAKQGRAEPAHPPPLFKIERWWAQDRLDFLCALKGALDSTANCDADALNLLSVAFCRSVISLSNAAFNHQSMSFKDPTPDLLADLSDHGTQFERDLLYVLSTASDNPSGDATVLHGDARHIDKIVANKFDLVVTSPPYPNRMSYIRELRPYMYWLGYLKEASEAAELDWNSIGGTWGFATSYLGKWQRSENAFRPGYFQKVLDEIAHVDNKNGLLLSNYVAKYFEDIYIHLAAMRLVLNADVRLHYVVGNSTFYGTLLPVERIYADMLDDLGYADVEIDAIRKRNSKKELIEFDVSARWPG